MAPANGATGKSTSGHGMPSRAAAGPRRPVVPVIPLSYLQHQRRKPPSTTADTVQPPPNAQPVGPKPSNNKNKSNHSTSNAVAQVQANETGPGPGHHGAGDPTAERHHATTSAAWPQKQGAPSESEAVTPPAAAAITLAAANGCSASPPSSGPSSKNGTAADTPIAHQASSTRVQQSVASPTPTRRRIGATPLHAINGSQHQLPSQPGPGVFHEPVGNHDGVPSMSQARVHQSHPSNGSLVFGGFYDSNRSSPAPPTGGVVQPSSSMSSYTSEGATAMGVDPYGRPFLVSPGFEGFPPDGFPPPPAFHPPRHHQHHHHGPPTPHSFHGSQSSTHADDSGHNGPASRSAGQSHRHMATMSLDTQSGLPFPLSGGSAPTCAVSGMQAQTLQFLRGGYERADFSDCTLELNITNARQPRDDRLVFPCHRFVISQSPTLNQMLRLRDIPAGGRLVLEVQDQYMRPDSFAFALRTLYGWDLGEGPLPPFYPQQSIQDAFDVALGYASSAEYLHLPFIHAKGIHHACHQLHWDTIEKACQFAIPRTFFGQSARHGISPSSDVFAPFALVEAINVFLVNNIPADFVLDVNAGDCTFSRLPRSSVTSAPGPTGPVIAHGTSRSRPEMQHGRDGSVPHAYMPRGPRSAANPRLSSIRFGDLSVANGQHVPNGQTDTARPRSPSHVDATLSRILLNLPFPMLKQVLEHPGLGKPSASREANAAWRLELISSIVAEREARRLASLSSGDTQLRVFVETLEGAPEPLVVREMGDFLVNSMGFREEVFPGDVPYLVQTWIHGGSEGAGT